MKALFAKPLMSEAKRPTAGRASRSTAALVFGLALLAAPFLSSASASPRDDDPVDTAVKTFTDAVSDRDVESIGDAMENLARIAKTLEKDDRDRDKIAAMFARMLDYPEREENGIPYLAASLLGMLGEPGAKILARALDDGDVDEDENVDFRDAMLEALGDTRHPSAVPTLLEFLKNAHASAVIAATNALAQFGELEGRARKEIVESLIRAAEYVESQTETQRTRPGGRAKYLGREWYAVVPAVTSTLRALTHANPGTTKDWREWFEENKGKNWDDEFNPVKKDDADRPDGR